jgi:predicted ribosome quality control (RQC) complex YloA/Tae2 family protein
MTLPARVSRVDTPTRGVLTLSLTAGPTRAVLLISARPSAPGVGLVSERLVGEPAGPFTTLLRGKLVGALLVTVHLEGRAAVLGFETKEGRFTLRAAPEGAEGAISLADERGRVHVGAARAPVETRPGEPLDWATLEARGEPLRERLRGGGLAAKRAALLRELAGRRRKLEKKRAAIAGDAARAVEAPRLRADAAFILASMHGLDRGATELEAVDYAEDPPRARKVPIDPSLGPAPTADALFRRARKLERGQTIAAERGARVDEELAALADTEAAIVAAADEAALLDLANGAGPRAIAAAPASARRATGRRPYRSFTSNDGVTILVGRSAADNDELTLRHARPEDLWLHARGTTGSHVVVKLARAQTCPAETLVDAATLAAHFSRFRADRDVEVQYTPRRYVRKRRGTPAGSVTLDRERVLLVTMEAGRIARLLATELRGG